MALPAELVVKMPTTTQHNLNTLVRLDTKITVQTTPPHPAQKFNSSLQEPEITFIDHNKIECDQ